jgi:hypothetical protein
MPIFSGRRAPFLSARRGGCVFGACVCVCVCVCVCGGAEAPPARSAGRDSLSARVGGCSGGCLEAARGGGHGRGPGCTVGAGRPRSARYSTPRALPQPLQIKLAALVPARPGRWRRRALTFARWGSRSPAPAPPSAPLPRPPGRPAGGRVSRAAGGGAARRSC